METVKIKVTPSEVIEYEFCPRFVYFMLYLEIPQHEEQHFKVQIGREIHEEKERMNKDYTRKKLDVEKKLITQQLSSEVYPIHGIVDEVLFMKDGTAAPLDFKFAEFEGKVYNTYKSQLVMYGMLIEENFGRPVKKGYLVYTRSKNELVEVEITEEDRLEVMQTVNEIISIIDKGYFPEGANSKKKCENCCYRNICVQ